MNFSYSIFLTSLSIFSYTLLIFHPDYCFVFCLSTNSWYLLSVLYNFIVFLLLLFVDSLFINFLTVSCLSFLLYLFLSLFRHITVHDTVRTLQIHHSVSPIGNLLLDKNDVLHLLPYKQKRFHEFEDRM